MALGNVVRLTNGLRKLKMCDIEADGGYSEAYEVADLTAMSAETSEGETSLAAGNGVIYSKKSVGKTSGSLSFYGMTDAVESKLFDIREGKTGGKIYGLKANKGYKAVIVEFTAVNPATGIEEDGYMIFPKCVLGMISEEGSTKDADGNETINTKSLAFTALALDNNFKTYKYINVGDTPSTLTADMFEEKVATLSTLSRATVGESVLATEE